MRKTFIALLSLALLASCSSAETKKEASSEPAKSLNFNSDGKFKILQVTDVHFASSNPESAVAIKLLNEILDAEKPDLVAFTGDLAWENPGEKAFDEVLAPVIERKIPWTFVFGNHDDEQGSTREVLMDYITKKPYCYASTGDENIKGVGNYIVEVKSNTVDSVKSVLYFFDSGSYTQIEGIGAYDWLHFNQIEWYKNQSAAYTASNAGKPLPSLAFFHIPLAEYNLMSKEDIQLIGQRKEDECNGKLNSGMFAAMRESGDVMGTFVGHDHDNDYIGCYYDIALAYGRYSGGKTVYNSLGANGCRVIELTEGKREFTTYIRLLGGEKLYEAKYPDSFPKPIKKK